MFSALRFCAAVVLMASLTTAVDIQPLIGATSGGSAVITWTPDETLPIFSIELANPNFHNSLAIANNVDPSKGSISVVIPPVPVSSGYTLQFVNITDINQDYGTSNEFSIAPTVSQSSTATSSAATETVLSLSLSSSATATMPMSSPMASMSTASSLSASSSVSSSAGSHSASSAAIPRVFPDASPAAACAGVVILGLLSVLWIL